jgi:hypothetical protein
MPWATVQNTTGAIIILMSAMKLTPVGFIAAPRLGYRHPTQTPGTMASRTWT